MTKGRATSNPPYRRPPLRVVEGIPVFCEPDGYVRNYERIAADHLSYMAEHNANPFMTDAQVEDADNSTRRLIDQFVSEGAWLLDAGVGTGSLIGRLTKYHRFGVDISLDYLRIAREHRIDVALSKIEDLPYASKTFDAVVITDVIEHILRLDDAVDEMSRVLKDSGILLVRAPNQESLKSYVEEWKYEYTHVRNFDVNSLRLYFEKVHKFEYVAHSFSGYNFAIADQLLVRPPKNASEIVAAFQGDRMSKAYQMLRGLAAFSEDALVGALIDIRENKPELAKRLFPVLLRPLEVNVVFRKTTE